MLMAESFGPAEYELMPAELAMPALGWGYAPAPSEMELHVPIGLAQGCRL